jgi:radical SAM superfamily enzyme YgiQ (UPF0313 family)
MKLRAKVYTIVGYPGESETAAIKTNLTEACWMVDDSLRNRIVLALKPSHFIPYQKTPMWNAEFNQNNVRPAAIERPVLYDGKNIVLHGGGRYTPTPLRAMVSTVIQRTTTESIGRARRAIDLFAKGGAAMDVCGAIADECASMLAAQTEQALSSVTTGTEAYWTDNNKINSLKTAGA